MLVFGEEQVALAAPLPSALLSPKLPFVAIAGTTQGGWGRGCYTIAAAGLQQGHKELYANT